MIVSETRYRSGGANPFLMAQPFFSLLSNHNFLTIRNQINLSIPLDSSLKNLSEHVWFVILLSHSWPVPQRLKWKPPRNGSAIKLARIPT